MLATHFLSVIKAYFEYMHYCEIDYVIKNPQMSVIVSDSRGWLVDSQSFINDNYSSCHDGFMLQDANNTSTETYRFKKEYFNIFMPHIVSQPKSENVETKTSEDNLTVLTGGVDAQKKKGRKRKRDLNQGELDAQVYHEKIRLLVQEGAGSLVDVGKSLGYLTGAGPAGAPQTSIPQECHLAAMCDMAKSLPVDDTVASQSICGDEELDLFSRVTENSSDHSCAVTLMGERYLLPARCRFLLSDITRTHPLRNCGEKFDLIVLDPPWENKSVKRSSRYSFLPSTQLKQLPINLISSPECLVVTWVTNRPKHQRFVKEELYPHWGVKPLAEWLWVKVTQAGDFVFPLDSPHKKPYEVLVLGRYHCDENVTTSKSEAPLPDQRLIVSVPSTLHSQKPCLSAVLKPYISPNPKCLEMFARSLHSDWTSWGNEALKFQHISYFTKDTTDESHSTGQ
ncbi:N(6)-adenine-specific methyltransferase METTL4 isoform X2 [Sardina pilchardus]|uniref:N(6)-adenine-specific methyltransferase METTL4 isoform X2 n=1 Tax=Sardina pilchardus TaxID=27697 RepID=UPI002E13F2DD